MTLPALPALPAAGATDVREAAPERLTFGPFELRLDQRALLREGRTLRLGSRAVELLILLAGRPGRVVGNAEILAALWPGLHVGEANIRVHVAAVRRALGDRRDTPRYVVNVPGRGYCFIAPVGRHDGGLAPVANAPAVSLPAVSPPIVHLPPAPSGLIGREDLLETLVELLPRRRLVTLVGPGGIGKTSLAVAAAHRRVADYPDGVRFVDLAVVPEPASPALAVASAIGVDGSAPLPAILAALRDRHMLLVVDNCERVIQPVAALIEALLVNAGRIDILATSREPLRAQGEWVRRLPGLPVPPAEDGVGAAEAASYPAVALFLERLRAAAGGFTLHDRDVPALIRICRRLDGIPLALELAAAYGAMLGIGGLAAHLDDQLDLLAHGRRTAPARHQTLRAMLDWSYDLLPALERRVLARLSTFGGPFDLDAAVTAGRAEAMDEAAVVDAVFRLVDASLIVVEAAGSGYRFRLLETTRAYAAAKLRGFCPA